MKTKCSTRRDFGLLNRRFKFQTLSVAIAVLAKTIIGATLEKDWQHLPEVNTKPEGGFVGPIKPVKGGNEWKEDVQKPDLVPVKFYGIFKAAECDIAVTLAGVSVSTYDPWEADDPENPYLETPTNTVFLKPYETYAMRLSGEMVYQAEGFLEPPSLNNLFSSKTAINQPARLYLAYWWNKATEAWEKICGDSGPSWGIDSWESVDEVFQVQIRPDLGARPVSKPQLRPADGEDQADDAWTRDEPAINATTAPGDGDPVEMASSKLGQPSSVRFNWAAYMGRLWSGAGAGKIRLSEFGFTTNTYTPRILNYAPRSSDTNEVMVVMDLDNTNCLSQVKAPQALATLELLYGSALLVTNDLIDISSLRQKLTNQTGLVSAYLWTNFSTQGQQTLLDTNSTQAQLQSTLITNLNPILQGVCVYESNRFAGVSLSGRTRRLLLLNPQGTALIRANRFLLEDAYPAEIAKLKSTNFDLNYYIASLVGPLDSLGFFTVTSNAAPFVTWRLGLPEGVTNQWRLQEIRNGTTNTSLLAYGPTNGVWTLTRGTGNEARIETRTITTNTVAGANRAVELQEIKNGESTICDRTVEVFQSFDWGYELVAVTNDPGGANLVTTFTYFSNTNDPATHGKIESIMHPDRFWERREYSHYDPYVNWEYLYAPYGSLIRVIQPWKNTTIDAEVNDCLVTDYAYNVYYPGSYKVQRWHDALGVTPWSTDPTWYDPTLGRGPSVVFEEETDFYTDPCAAQQAVLTEVRQLGDLEHYGEFITTKTFDAYYGRLAGHLFSKTDALWALDSYDYEFGAWDSTNLAFVVGEEATNDVRQTIFHGATGPTWLLSGFEAYPYDTIYYGPSGAAIDPVFLELSRSTKEVRIMHQGNLAAKEIYVYEGDITNFALVERVIYLRDSLGHATNVFRIDPATQQTRVIYTADWKGTNLWPADLKFSETDESGTVLASSYDSLKRLKTLTKLPATGQTAIVTALSYDAAGRVLTNTISAGSLSQKTITHFDLAGRKTDETNPAGLTTTFTYQDGGRQTTATQSSGTTAVISNFPDRRVASITGNAVTNQFFDYDLTWISFSDALYPKNVTRVTLGSSNALRWTETITDQRYQAAAESKPAFGTTNVYWKEFAGNAGGGLPGAILESGMVEDIDFRTDIRYFANGERYAEWRWGPDTNSWFSGLSSKDRVTAYSSYFAKDAQNHWFQVSEKWGYPYEDDATPVLIERTKERLTGFGSAQVSETQQFDADTNQTTIKVSVDLAAIKLTTTVAIPQSSLTATQIVVNGLLQTESTPTVAAVTTHYYDALGREIATRDPLGNVTGTRYDATTGEVTATTNALGLVTTMEYYPASGTNAGLLKCVASPTGKKTYYNYNGRGQVTHIWGDVPYPEKRDYNEFGDQVALTTYRGGTQWTGTSWPSDTGPTADVTQWHRDEATGLLTNKTDAASQSAKFEYHPNHFPKIRVWARGLASTNIYSINGDLVCIDYSDSTPDVLFTNATYPYLSRRAQPFVIGDASGTWTNEYDHAGRLTVSTCTSGLLSGIGLSNHFSAALGRDAVSVKSSGTNLVQHSLVYDSYGRLSSVANGDFWAAYGYLPNSDLLQTTTCRSNSTTLLTTTRSWESGMRLAAIVNEANGVNVSSRSYTYDALNRRTRAALEDGSYWQYDYNDRNELTGARRYWPDWSPASGQHFGYDYDNIGSRKSASSGGDTNGWNLRTTGYTANNLNQYTAITTLGYEDILGVTWATNSVTVNGGAADRKGEYFHREITVTNGSNPVWQSVTASSGGVSSNGGFVFPKNNQSLTYDADGNLTFDGIWTYEWDAENRLKALTMTNVSGIPNAQRKRLELAYDYMNRRVQKVVKTWNGSAFADPVTNKFISDGWNLLAELDTSHSLLRSYTWGQDLSGTLDQAGGIGGLLLITFHGSPNTNTFVAYDGNGNVTALMRGGSGAVVASYEYSPYGELLRSTGPLAMVNPFRWSSKFWDEECGVVYYGYRYYSPAQGRWLGRDPIQEQDFDNLYLFLANNANAGVDPHGQFMLIDLMLTTAAQATMRARESISGASLVMRIRSTVNTLDRMQQFLSGYLEGTSVDATELIHSLDTARRALSQNFRGASSAAKAAAIVNDGHHVFPKAFIKFFRNNNVDPERLILKINGYLHRYGMHGFGGVPNPRGGGAYNALWEEFVNKHKNTKGRPDYVIGFGLGLLTQIFPKLFF